MATLRCLVGGIYLTCSGLFFWFKFPYVTNLPKRSLANLATPGVKFVADCFKTTGAGVIHRDNTWGADTSVQH